MTAKIYSFNDRSQGIFSEGFKDRDGRPVGDTAAARFRHKVCGAQSKDMSRDELAALVAAHTSEQIDLVLAAAPTLPGEPLGVQSLEEFKRNDGIVHAWLTVLPDSQRAALITMALDCGYQGEEQSVLVDVLRLAQTIPVSIFHEHDGNTGRAVALFEQWCDEELEQRRQSDHFSQSN